MDSRETMRTHSSILGIVLLGFVPGLCGQEAAPTAPATQPVAQSAPPTAQPVAAQPAAAASVPSVTTSAAFGEITGAVKSGNVLLPGVAVSAANTLTGKKYSTSTDVDGTFKISVTGKGRYVVRAEFSAFAPVTQEVLINEQNRNGKADLAMELLSRTQKEAQQEQRQQVAQQLAGRAGMQQLALAGGGDTGGGANTNSDAGSLAGAGL